MIPVLIPAALLCLGSDQVSYMCLQRWPIFSEYPTCAGNNFNWQRNWSLPPSVFRSCLGVSLNTVFWRVNKAATGSSPSYTMSLISPKKSASITPGSTNNEAWKLLRTVLHFYCLENGCFQLSWKYFYTVIVIIYKMLLRPSYERCLLCFTSLFWLTDHLSERQFIVFVQNRWNPFAQCIWALENMKGSEDILWDLTWSKSDYKFIIHLGNFADFLSSLNGLWTACNFIVNVRLMLDECFKQNLCCLGSIYLTHWDVFILCFMVYITNYGIYIPFPDRLTIYPLN